MAAPDQNRPEEKACLVCMQKQLERLPLVCWRRGDSSLQTESAAGADGAKGRPSKESTYWCDTGTKGSNGKRKR